MIYILAGETRSGKTSALMEWKDTWDNVKGILCPEDKDDIRQLYSIETEENHSFQQLDPSDETITVGRFHFLKDTFKLANYILIKTFEEGDFEFLVLDELGRLELENEGIHQAADFIISNYQSTDDRNLLLVVRTSLVKDIINHYGITSYQIVAAETLP